MLEYLVLLLTISLIIAAIGRLFQNRIPLRIQVIYGTVGISFLLGSVFPLVISSLSYINTLAIYFCLLVASGFALSYAESKVSLNVSPTPVKIGALATDPPPPAEHQNSKINEPPTAEEASPEEPVNSPLSRINGEPVDKPAGGFPEELPEETAEETPFEPEGAIHEKLQWELAHNAQEGPAGRLLVEEPAVSPEQPPEELAEGVTAGAAAREHTGIDFLNEKATPPVAGESNKKEPDEVVEDSEGTASTGARQEKASFTDFPSTDSPTEVLGESPDTETGLNLNEAGDQPPEREPEHSTATRKTQPLAINDYILKGFKAKTEGNYAQALDNFIKALHCDAGEQLSASLAMEISSLYRELGQYHQAVMFLRSMLGQKPGILDNRLRHSLYRQLVNLEIISHLLKLARMPNAPYSKIPSIIKIKAYLETTERLKATKNNKEASII